MYGADAFLFGVDFALSDWAELCDEVGAREYERGEPLTWDGLKLQRSTTLEPGNINAVVLVLDQLIVLLDDIIKRNGHLAAPVFSRE